MSAYGNCDELFMQALSTIKTLTHLSSSSDVPRPPLVDRINLYGIYKQATEGDTNIPEPDPLIDHAAYTKWHAWKSNDGLSPNEAKKRYVQQLIQLLISYGNEYTEVVQLRQTMQLYWDRYNSKPNKYGSISYMSPPTPTPPAAVLTSSSIIRSHSPAASLYRIASSGVNRKVNRSRNGSLNGTTALNASSTTSTTPTSINDINACDNNNLNIQELNKWQSDINKTLGKISNELANFKNFTTSNWRSLSQSTTPSFNALISNKDEDDKNISGERKKSNRWLLSKIQMVLNYLREQMFNAYGLWCKNNGILRDMMIVLIVILVQQSPFLKRGVQNLENFTRTSMNLILNTIRRIQ